jgi:hypothetical protein
MFFVILNVKKAHQNLTMAGASNFHAISKLKVSKFSLKCWLSFYAILVILENLFILFNYIIIKQGQYASEVLESPDFEIM